MSRAEGLPLLAEALGQPEGVEVEVAGVWLETRPGEERSVVRWRPRGAAWRTREVPGRAVYDEFGALTEAAASRLPEELAALAAGPEESPREWRDRILRRERALDARVKNQRREIAALLAGRAAARAEAEELRRAGAYLRRVLRRHGMGVHDGSHDPEDCAACALALAGRRS